MINKALYAFLHRIDARAWVIAAALGCVWLSAGAANSGNIGRVGQTTNGRSTTVGPVTNSTGSTIPISPSIGGWTQAGNYGMPTAATGQTVGHVGFNGDFIVGGSASARGVKYPATGDYSIPWSTVGPIAAGLVCAVATAGVCGVAGAVAAASPYIMDWIGKAGLSRNQQTGQIEQPEIDDSWPKSDGYQWMVLAQGQAFKDTREEACYHVIPFQDNSVFRFEFDHITTTGGQAGFGQCFARQYRKSDGGLNQTVAVGPFSKGVASNCPLGWYKTPAGCVSPGNLPKIAATVSQVADALGRVVPDPRVWGETIGKGGEVPLPNPTVTGPTQIQGPERTTTNPDGSRTVERTTYNFQTAGNTITNTSNVTNTTTYNIDNSVRSTSSTTTTPTPEEADKDDACEKRPNSAGCADLDTPTGEIPKETKTITYAEEQVFGAGSCPADKQWSSGTTGHSYKLVDWGTLCSYAAPARVLVILLAIFAAFLIVMPGKEVRT